MNKLCVFTLSTVLAVAAPGLAAAESYTLHQTLRQVIQTYPSVEIARLQTKRAQQDVVKASSMLGWTLGGQVGAKHDLSAFSGTPSDSANLMLDLNRPLASGGSYGIGGSYSYEDSSFSFSPTFPNPSHFTRMDANYRKPLAKGAGNPLFNEGLKSAKAGERIARANEISARDGLATQTMGLFFMAALTKTQLETSNDAVERARRLKKFTRSNARLGLSEKKDTLQVEAQLQARLADYDALVSAWEQQRTSINRLLNRPRTADFTPVLRDKDGSVNANIDTILGQVNDHSPDLHRQLAQIDIAESQLATSKDSAKSTFDLVFGVGIGNKQGPATPAVNETDYATSVRLEFRKSLNSNGADAVVTQAMLGRSIALREAERIRVDMKYNVAGLISEIEKTHQSYASQQRRVIVERKNVDEIGRLYRTGRMDTAQLIRFENEYQLSKLAREVQRIELARKHATLELMRGILLYDAIAPTGGAKGDQ